MIDQNLQWCVNHWTITKTYPKHFLLINFPCEGIVRRIYLQCHLDLRSISLGQMLVLEHNCTFNMFKTITCAGCKIELLVHWGDAWMVHPKIGSLPTMLGVSTMALGLPATWNTGCTDGYRATQQNLRAWCLIASSHCFHQLASKRFSAIAECLWLSPTEDVDIVIPLGDSCKRSGQVWWLKETWLRWNKEWRGYKH